MMNFGNYRESIMEKFVLSMVTAASAVTLLGCATSEQPSEGQDHSFNDAAFEFILGDLGDELVLPPNLADASFVVYRPDEIMPMAIAAATIIDVFQEKPKDESLRELEALPFFARSAAGRAYLDDPDNRALVFGFPRERCPFHVTSKDEEPIPALMEAYARCLERMPKTPFSGGCGCRAEVFATHLLVEPSTLDYRELLSLSMITLDPTRTDSEPEILRGLVRAGEVAGRSMPVELLTADGDSLCKGEFNVKTLGSLDFTVNCPASGVEYSGRGGLVGYNHGRSYGVGVGGSLSTAKNVPERVMVAWFGYDEPKISTLEDKTIAFMKTWHAEVGKQRR